jgi:hypothetical protein
MGYGRFKQKNFRLFILGLVQVVLTAFPNVPTAARATAAWLSNQTDIVQISDFCNAVVSKSSAVGWCKLPSRTVMAGLDLACPSHDAFKLSVHCASEFGAGCRLSHSIHDNSEWATHEIVSAPVRVSVTPSQRCDTVALARRRIGRKPGDGCSRTRAFAPRPWGISCRTGIRLGSRSLQESDFCEPGCERRAFSWKRIWALSFPRKRESRNRQSMTGCPRSRA